MYIKCHIYEWYLTNQYTVHKLAVPIMMQLPGSDVIVSGGYAHIYPSLVLKDPCVPVVKTQ